MQVQVRYFAALRERRGAAEERVDVPVGTTPAQLYAHLFPDLITGGKPALPVLYAVNQEYAAGDRPLADGDEVAFIPPLGGG